jgi:hypothetical protein
MKQREKISVRIGKLTELTPDRNNANKGTHRGRAMLENSVRRYGVGRPILADKHGRIIAGNKTLEAVGFAGIEDALIVPTDGKRLIVHQRTDLDLETDAEAKEIAVVDNQANAVGLAFEGKTLAQIQADGADVQQFFRAPEWSKLTAAADVVAGEEIPEMALQPFEEYNYLVLVFKNSQDWQGVCDLLNVRREKVTLGTVRKVGLGRVLEGAAFLERLQQCESKSSSRRENGRTGSAKARSASSQTRRSASAKAKSPSTES